MVPVFSTLRLLAQVGKISWWAACATLVALPCASLASGGYMTYRLARSTSQHITYTVDSNAIN